MSAASVDRLVWLEVVAADPQYTSTDRIASFAFAGGQAVGLTNEQLEESYNKFVRAGYIEEGLFPDGTRYRLTLPEGGQNERNHRDDVATAAMSDLLDAPPFVVEEEIADR